VIQESDAAGERRATSRALPQNGHCAEKARSIAPRTAQREGLRGFFTTRSPKQSGGRGAGGRRGPPLVQCVKQDRGDMVPVDEVEKQTLMLQPPCRIRISAFRRRKKASAEPHACPVAAWVPVQSPADPTDQTCRGARVADESKAVGASVGRRRLCSFRMRDPRWLADSALLYLSRQRLSRTPPSHLP
jgi:hypothetical protein